jgi:metallo-beta-lactamase family protein
MAQHTLGRRLEELGSNSPDPGSEPPEVKILGKSYPLKARVEKIGGFSAHGDKHELMQIITQSNLNIENIAVVHGEKEQSQVFADRLGEKGFNAFIPKPGDKFRI